MKTIEVSVAQIIKLDKKLLVLDKFDNVVCEIEFKGELAQHKISKKGMLEVLEQFSQYGEYNLKTP